RSDKVLGLQSAMVKKVMWSDIESRFALSHELMGVFLVPYVVFVVDLWEYALLSFCGDMLMGQVHYTRGGIHLLWHRASVPYGTIGIGYAGPAPSFLGPAVATPGIQVWMEAGTQVFYSYSTCAGALTVLGSYNTYNNNCYRDCFMLCLLNSCTSIMAGFAVFSVLGFMAHEHGKPIMEVAESGPGLGFIAYPQAVAMIPLPQLWSVCFFIMLILLCIDTQFVALEGIITSMSDLFPRVLRRAGRRELFLLFFSVLCLFSQLILVTEITFIYYLVGFEPLRFNRRYVYPAWAYGLGWLLALSSVLMVPGWALGSLWRLEGSLKQRWLHLCSSDKNLPLTKKQRANIQDTTSAAEMDNLMVKATAENHA
ncbi:hypothetical protein NFI96_007446, partial [Prochilodus magdalenae]